MTKLTKQPTAFPTRKLMAVMIAGAIVGLIQSGLAFAWPDHPFAPLLAEADIWVQAAVMALAGYMTKERAQ